MHKNSMKSLKVTSRMKHKGLKVLGIASALAIALTMPSFAAHWGQIGYDWFYYLDDGNVAKSQWVTSEGGTFYVNADGKMAKNQWVNADGKWYFVDASGLMLKNTAYEDGTKKYWLGEDGVMLSNQWYQLENGVWHYYSESGVALSNGWYLIDGYYYYFMKSSSMAVDALISTGNRVGPDGRWIEK